MGGGGAGGRGIVVTLSTEGIPYRSGILVLFMPHIPPFCVLSSCLKYHLDRKSYVLYSLHSVRMYSVRNIIMYSTVKNCTIEKDP